MRTRGISIFLCITIFLLFQGGLATAFGIYPKEDDIAYDADLLEVKDAVPGGTVTLGVKVKNIGFSRFDDRYAALFFVEENPPFLSLKSVSTLNRYFAGSVSLEGLEVNASGWYYINWDVPTDIEGHLKYYAALARESDVYFDNFDKQHAHLFTKYKYHGPEDYEDIPGYLSYKIPHMGIRVIRPSVRVMEIKSRYGVKPGSKVNLSARLENTGKIDLDSDSKTNLYFVIKGQKGQDISDTWVGPVPVDRLRTRSRNWYKACWTLPSNLTSEVNYTYTVIVKTADYQINKESAIGTIQSGTMPIDNNKGMLSNIIDDMVSSITAFIGWLSNIFA